MTRAKAAARKPTCAHANTPACEPTPAAPTLVRCYRMQLQANRVQRRALAELLEGSRQVYNAALEEWIGAYRWACALSSRLGLARFTRKAVLALDPAALDPERAAIRERLLGARMPDYYTQAGALALKAQRAALGEVVHAAPCDVTRWALTRLDDARKAFFDRCKAGRTPGFPRFRPRSRWETFGFNELADKALTRPDAPRKGRRALGSVRLPGVPGLVTVRTHRALPDGAVVKAATVTRQGKRWTIAFACRVPAPAIEPDAALHDLADADVVGFDWGVAILATLDDGTAVPNPRPADRLRAGVRRASRQVARARRGSKGRKAKVRRLAAAKRREADARKTALRQAAARVVGRAQDRDARAVALEKLQVRNMTRSAAGTVDEPGQQVAQKRGLNRAILDAAPAAFASYLRTKAESAGLRFVEVDPRRTSIACSGCGAAVPKTLSMRTHACPACGLVLDRDHNAAVNIARRGAETLRALALAS